jgi:hypothetical protein
VRKREGKEPLEICWVRWDCGIIIVVRGVEWEVVDFIYFG